MSDYIVVTFFTLASPYEREAEGLAASCELFGIPCHIKGYPSRGKWVRNAGIKPEFLLKMLGKYPDKDLLYLDADARVRQHPVYFDHFDGDIGVHYLEDELLSGTIYLKNTPAVRAVIEAWAVAQSEEPEVWDQKVLAKVLSVAEGVHVVDIPAAYCQIFDTMEGEGPPVIEQMQASRCYKDLVNDHASKAFSGHPIAVGKSLVRTASDGTLFITDPDPIAEQFLDERFSRIPGTLRWHSRS